jgi:hypothetical protein
MLAKGSSKVGTMKSITEMRRFEKLAGAFLRAVGAVDSGDNTFPLQLETKAGLLLLTTGVFGAVNGRFQEVKRARALLNPTKLRDSETNLKSSGAWLHQYYHSPLSADEALEDFRSNLTPILNSNILAENE